MFAVIGMPMRRAALGIWEVLEEGNGGEKWYNIKTSRIKKKSFKKSEHAFHVK